MTQPEPIPRRCPSALAFAAFMAVALGCAEERGSTPDAPAGDDSPGISAEAQAEWDLVTPDGVGAGPGAKEAFGVSLGSYCGIEAHSNGPTTPSGHYDGSSPFGLRWQCTEYAFRFLCTHYNPLNCRETGKVGLYGNAKHWYPNTQKDPILASLDRYANGGVEPPRAGDILTFGNGAYGHVAVVREVRLDTDPPYVSVIEQNVTGTARDGNNRHRLHLDDGHYRITNAQGWMRVPGSSPACGTNAPELLAPDDYATFSPDTPINFAWVLGDVEENHTLKVRHIESNAIVYERILGQLTQETISFDAPGLYRWVVSHANPGCDADGCVSVVRHFTIGGAPPEPEPAPQPAPEPAPQPEPEPTPRPEDERCNGVDDDADGRIDEGLTSAWSAWGACGGFADQCAEAGEQSRLRTHCDGGQVVEEEEVRGCRRDTDGAPCAGGRCADARCEADGLGFHLELDPEGWSARGACDPMNSRELYRGRVTRIDVERNRADLEFAKCDETNPSQDLTAWVAVTDIEFPLEGQLCVSPDCTRQETVWRARDARLTVTGVPIWPNLDALLAAPCNSEKRLYLLTDGREREGLRTWYQAQSIGLRKICD